MCIRWRDLTAPPTGQVVRYQNACRLPGGRFSLANDTSGRNGALGMNYLGERYQVGKFASVDFTPSDFPPSAMFPEELFSIRPFEVKHIQAPRQLGG